MTTKQQLRQLIRQRQQLSHPADESAAIIKRIKQNIRVRLSRTLLLYSALPDEVQTQSLIDDMVAQGKTVLLPRVISATDMELRHYTDSKDLQPGAFNILEPIGDIFTDYSKIDVAIIPGMAFDTQGNRLGRGRGYYDRFLTRLSGNVYKIGVCFPWQVQDTIPSDGNDIPMDAVIY